jgi:hypothetical protein
MLPLSRCHRSACLLFVSLSRPQYRSIILYTNEQQKEVAQQVRRDEAGTELLRLRPWGVQSVSQLA